MDQPLRLITREKFAELVAKGESVDGVGVIKGYTAEVKADTADELSATIRITTGSRDRDRDTVSPAGWKLDDYRKNPVVLWGHDYRLPPVARDEGLSIDAKGLLGTPRFTDQDLNPFGYMIGRMLRAGFLNAASVGFQPIKWSFNEAEGGVDFEEQLLLEYSIVPVPANPEALVGAKSAGIDLLPLKSWAESVLDSYHQEAGIWLPRKSVERAFMLVAGEPVSVQAPGTPGQKSEGSATETSPEPETTSADAPAPTEPTVERGTAEPEGLVFELVDEPLVVELADEAPATGEKGATFEVDTAQLAEVIGASVTEALSSRWTALTGRLD